MIALTLGGVSTAHAAGTPTDAVLPLVNPLGSTTTTVTDLLHNIVNTLLAFGTPIAVAMVLVGGFQMLFAGGDPEKFAAGRRTILYAAIGYAIIFIGWGFTTLIESILR